MSDAVRASPQETQSKARGMPRRHATSLLGRGKAGQRLALEPDHCGESDVDEHVVVVVEQVGFYTPPWPEDEVRHGHIDILL